jgi:hypothetical protein
MNKLENAKGDSSLAKT